MEIFKFLVPSFKGKITFISQGKGAAGILPMVEVLKKSIDYGLYFFFLSFRRFLITED
jgi:hypothetical protein